MISLVDDSRWEEGRRLPAVPALLLSVSGCWSGSRIRNEMGARPKETDPQQCLCFWTLRFGRPGAPTGSRATQFGSETADRSAVSAGLLAQLLERLMHTSKPADLPTPTAAHPLLAYNRPHDASV